MLKFLVFIWLMFYSLVAGALSERVIKQDKEVVFKILNKAENTVGTGFLVKLNNGIFLMTNRHVCGSGIDFVIYNEVTDESYTATVALLGKVIDVCLLKIPKKVSEHKKVFIIKSYKVFPNEILYSFGHPFGLNLVFVWGAIKSYSYYPVKLSEETQLYPLIKAEFECNGGQSGSPVVNKDNKVIGIVTFLFREENSIAGIIPITEVLKEL